MNILWISAFNETEYDIALTFHQWRKHNLHIICPMPSNDYFFEVNMKRFKNITYSKNLDDFVKKVDAYLNKNDVDLIIKRAGWGTQKSPFLVPTLAKQHDIPCALWCAEQGEQRDWQVAIARHYKLIFTNNKMDYEYYRIVFPKARIFMLPFGCVPSFHKPVKATKKYKTDIVVYGNPLFYHYQSKKRCIEDMIFPLLQKGYKIAVWGLDEWNKIPAIKRESIFKGSFPYADLPKVNASCKLMLGMSASIYHGGYGSKLIRALACGTPTVWHDTVGINDDFRNGYHVALVNSQIDTLTKVNFYLDNTKHRKDMGKRGRKFAVENLDYKILFGKLFDELYEGGIL